MRGDDFSERLEMKWTSEETMTRWGFVLKLAAVSLSFGRRRRPRRKVDMTLMVIVDSKPSTRENLEAWMPAFSTTMSRRLRSEEARVAKVLTLSWEARSSCHTSTTPVLLVLSSMDFFAVSPFETVRHAIMTFSAPSRV